MHGDILILFKLYSPAKRSKLQIYMAIMFSYVLTIYPLCKQYIDKLFAIMLRLKIY
jgi:hypothetical protein